MKLKFDKKIICILLVILIPLLILLLLKNKESFSLGGQGRKGRNIKRRLKKSKTGRSAFEMSAKLKNRGKQLKTDVESSAKRAKTDVADKMSEKTEGMRTAYSVGKARMKARTGDRTSLDALANQMITGSSKKNATEVARNMRVAAQERLNAQKNMSVLTADELLDTSHNREDLKSVVMNIELNKLIGNKSVNKRLIRERLATLAEQDAASRVEQLKAVLEYAEAYGDSETAAKVKQELAAAQDPRRTFGRQNFAGKLISRTKAGTESRLSEVKKIRTRLIAADERRKAQTGSTELQNIDEMEPMRRISYNAAVDSAQQKFDERQKRGKRAPGRFVASAALGAGALATSSGVGATILGGAAIGYAADATYIAIRDKLRNRKNSKNFERTKIVLKRSTEAAKAAESAKAVASVPIPSRRRPAPIPPGR